MQAAERAREVAVARAQEERRRRRVQLALAASVLALTILGGLSTACTTCNSARPGRRPPSGWRTGWTRCWGRRGRSPKTWRTGRWLWPRLDQAETGGEAPAHGRLPALRTEIEAGLEAAQRDRTLLERVVDIRSAEADDPDGSLSDHAYADAFAAAGLDLAILAAGPRRGRGCSPPGPCVCDPRRRPGRLGRHPRAGAAADMAGAGALEPPPPASPTPTAGRNEFRTLLLDQSDRTAFRAALQALARKAQEDDPGPISLHLLGTSLFAAGDHVLAESVLRRASSGIRRTSGSTTHLVGCWRRAGTSMKRSASTAPPAPSARRPPTSWPTPWRSAATGTRRLPCFTTCSDYAPAMPGTSCAWEGL